MSSAILQNNPTSLSSSSSSFLGHHNLKNLKSANVVKLIPRKINGVVKCVVDPPSAEKTAYMTKVSRNKNMAKLQAGYLFPEMARRRSAHMLKDPDAQGISVGIGDVPKPIEEVIKSTMSKRSHALATIEGYSGYGAEQDEKLLRAAITSTYYSDLCISEDDIYVSDGAKSDISRLQMLFGSNLTMAVQDPSYPAYEDSSAILSPTVQSQKDLEKYQNIEYMECTPENGFFPDLSTVHRTDIIFFCSPHKPTGHAASREQLNKLVQFAKENGSIIVYDSTYAMCASDDSPRSIFEIPGAKEVALEVSSFSPSAGFLPLGWTAIPKELLYSDGCPVAKDFDHIVCTPIASFVLASNIAQSGGQACVSWLSPDCIEWSSWRVAVEANNLGPWKTVPEKYAPWVQEFMMGKGYALELQMVSNSAAMYARSVNLTGDGKDVWIFDVDDTLLSTLPYYTKHGFGSEIFNPAKFDPWVETGMAPAIPSIMKLYEEVLGLGFKVVFLTGRSERLRDITVENLSRAGFQGWEKLILRSAADHGKTATDYKSDKRSELVEGGYRIWGNIGDQWTDLLGSAMAERSFKLPNAMYHIS